MSRAKAIRKKCLECCGGSPREVRLCAITDCPLWSYRSGRVPRKNTPQKAPISRPEEEPGG